MATAFVGGSVLHGDGTVSAADVLLDGQTVAAVGVSLDMPPGTRVFDVSGKTVLPGFIDAHTHLTHGYEASVTDTEAAQGVRANRQALRALRAGVTTIRELGSYRRVDIALRNAINAGLAVGPRMLCAGTYIAITGGHGHPKGRAADGPQEVRKAVREQILAGADVIKMMCSGGAARRDESADAAQFTSEEISAAAEEAHFAGRPFAAHAHPTRSIKWALQAGADSLEHGTYLDEECIDLMLEHSTYLVPTLGVYRSIATSPQWPDLVERATELYAAKTGTLRRALERGVRVAVGTDSSAFFPIERYAEELELLVSETDLTARDVLLMATSGNASLLGLEGVGVVQPGYRADLVILDGDPVADLTNVGHVSFTVRDGAVFDWASVGEALGV